MTSGAIRIGIGGWSYEPWRQTFYPQDVPKKNELRYASRQVTAIEINSTFYRLQHPGTYRKWREEVPKGFVFSIKAPRYITHRRVLADCGASLASFLASGLDELGEKLGPILWSLPETTTFSPQDLSAFLQQLPMTIGEIPVRHALEVRHPSFVSERFVELARKHRVAIVVSHAHDYPTIADVSGDFIYARLRQSAATIPTGYSEDALHAWADRARRWASGIHAHDLPSISSTPLPRMPRDVFIFFISGAKERNPAAAQRLIELLRASAQ